MWQTLIVFGVLILALIYIIRHYAKAYRSDVPACSGCTSGCCSGVSKEETCPEEKMTS